ncbi:MAG: hypothetical protein UX35_C0001G0142 [Microgenomates group bacterium GW2011_GWA1_46_15]|nr:MAG: hypothetical protein UX00_C0001G0052 [Microgenomates group bacterium GW2011_GWB1_45_17]KKU24244.1 MAG: hypothetical protein UX36_C0002G0227 [Microgenomates group bacterium GW2011_GWC1_46_15]KKU24960.1 MAG: hypothetical protein UX35_C0001G0142 [Microgenomates group bacterium GW2011_GWA1_46_15]
MYTVKQVADILGFSTNTVYKYLNAGIIHTSRPGQMKSRFRISKKALEDYLGVPIDEYKSEKHARVEPLFSQEHSSSQSPIETVIVDANAQKMGIPEPPLEVKSAHEAGTEDHEEHNIAPSFALRTTRALLFITLIGVTLNLAFFSLPHPITLLSQLLILFVFLLLAYQYGGMHKKKAVV